MWVWVCVTMRGCWLGHYLHVIEPPSFTPSTSFISTVSLPVHSLFLYLFGRLFVSLPLCYPPNFPILEPHVLSCIVTVLSHCAVKPEVFRCALCLLRSHRRGFFLSDRSAAPDFLNMSNIPDATPMQIDWKCQCLTAHTLKRDFMITHGLINYLQKGGMGHSMRHFEGPARTKLCWCHGKQCAPRSIGCTGQAAEGGSHSGDVVTSVLQVMPHSHHAPGAWKNNFLCMAVSIFPFVAMVLTLGWGCCWSSCWSRRSSQESQKSNLEPVNAFDTIHRWIGTALPKCCWPWWGPSPVMSPAKIVWSQKMLWQFPSLESKQVAKEKMLALISNSNFQCWTIHRKIFASLSITVFRGFLLGHGPSVMHMIGISV